MKTTIAILVVAVFGFGSGVFVYHVRVGKTLAAERDQLRSELDQANRAAEDNARQAEVLQRQLAALDESFSQFMTTPPPPGTAMGVAVMSPQMEGTADEPAEVRDSRQRDLDSWEQRKANARKQQEQMQASGERIRDETQLKRRNSDQFYQEQLQQAPDRDTRERLATMHQYTDDLMAMRIAKMGAKTDKERQALDKRIVQTSMTLDQLQKDQQNAILRSLTSTYGITDPAAQDQFAQTLQQLLTSPFFRYTPENMWVATNRAGGMQGGLVPLMPMMPAD